MQKRSRVTELSQLISSGLHIDAALDPTIVYKKTPMNETKENGDTHLTALEVATENDDVAVCDVLLRHGANVTPRALALASFWNHNRVHALLRKAIEGTDVQELPPELSPTGESKTSKRACCSWCCWVYCSGVSMCDGLGLALVICILLIVAVALLEVTRVLDIRFLSFL